jgi:tetratricopeptide (TPR) repeat protein
MKRSFILIVLSSILGGFIVTGFQCGSAEMTSAKLYIQRKDWANAEKSLMKEVEKNSKNAEAWYMLGDVRREMGNFEGMLTAFENSLKNSQEFATEIEKRKLYVWQNAVNAGVNYYNKSIHASSDSASMLRMKAIEQYKIAIMVLPDSTLAYENIAIAYMAEGNIDEQIHYLKETVQRKNDPTLSITLINAYLKKGEDAKGAGKNDEAALYFNDAIEAIKNARKDEPDNADLLKALIDVHIAAGRAEEAMPFMTEAIQKDPSNKVLRNNYGLLLMKNDQVEKSIEQFDAAIATDSTYEDGVWNGAVAYMRLGEIMKKKAIEEAETNKKKDIDKSYVDKFKVASRLIEKLIALKPDEPKYWDGLATAYANAGMAKQAQKAFETADQLRKK